LRCASRAEVQHAERRTTSRGFGAGAG
jgi:hypothetical protein